MSFSNNFIDQLKDKISTADVIGRFVLLKRRGNEYQGLCPFHNEKTPSFTINNLKGFYYCFGCGAKGNAISFMMEHKRLSFKEAVEWLAEEYNIPIEKQLSKKSSSPLENNIRLAHECAAKFYAENLQNPRFIQYKKYLHERGINEPSIKSFGLGFASGSGLLEYLQKNSVTKQMAMKAQLLRENDRGTYETFRGRIMFPIRDKKGRVIAFGGRSIDGKEPKYLNSSEHPAFEKRSTLYNLDKALKELSHRSHFIVVEGYTDVIALATNGVKTSVASLGTAFTAEHLKELWRYDAAPIFCFDGDTAGQAAMKRVISIALEEIKAGYTVQFALLPQGQDPDSLVREAPDQFNELIKKPLDLEKALWTLLHVENTPVSPDEIRYLQKTGLDYIAKIKDNSLKTLYKNAFLKTFNERYLRAEKHGPPSMSSKDPLPPQQPKGNKDYIKNLVLACVYRVPELAEDLLEKQDIFSFSVDEHTFIDFAVEYLSKGFKASDQPFAVFLAEKKSKKFDFLKEVSTLCILNPFLDKSAEIIREHFLRILEEAEKKMSKTLDIDAFSRSLKDDLSHKSWQQFKQFLGTNK